MTNENINITDIVPEFPSKPTIEISRDSFIRWITNEFNPKCQKQLIACGPLTGKSNFISQFTRYYKNRVISYFINSNPTTQDLQTFLYVICSQISMILEEKQLPIGLNLDDLKSTFTGSVIKLADLSKKNNETYYFAIDGLEWGQYGDKGRRIIDFPLVSFSNGPYILYSCRTENKDILSQQEVVVRDDINSYLEFNLTDSKEYLSHINLTEFEIEAIHNKAKGLPGYLSIIRDAIGYSGKKWINTNELPDSLESLIGKQINRIREVVAEKNFQALEFIAISPKPLGVDLLSKLMNIEEKSIISNLKKTGIVSIDEKSNSLQITPEYTREVLVKEIGIKKDDLIRKLLEIVKLSENKDELLLTLLQKDANDYDGMQIELSNKSIISVLKKSNTKEIILKRFQMASEMAYQKNDLLGLINYGLGSIATRSFLSQTIDIDEISALISMGESEKAIKLAYSLPESVDKIRLLANAYSVMKGKKERVPKEAIDELRLLVNNLNLADTDKESAQLLAIDLLPLLPDEAVEILENYISKQEKKNLFESAVSDIATTSSKDDNLRISETLEPEPAFNLSTAWLKNPNFAQLEDEITKVNNIKAKEYIIRNWCVNHQESDELNHAINYWIDLVVSDNNFIIQLHSLRQISGLLKKINNENLPKLIKQLEIPAFISLRTPWEEWIGFQLNIAEANYRIDPEKAKSRITEIYETINIEINDYDIKIFCYARLYATVSNIYNVIAEDVKNNFERVLSSLLSGSALHDEILIKSLKIIAPIDVDYAIEKALEMNTLQRRQKAIKAIVISFISRCPDQGLEKILKRIIPLFDNESWSRFLVHICYQLSCRENVLNEQNQEFLLISIRRISDNSLKTQGLSYLLILWTNEKFIKVKNLIKEIISYWEKEEDLRKKIAVGFDLVEKISEKDNVLAKELFAEVQKLKFQPGAALSIGNLGRLYFNAVKASIEALKSNDFINNKTLLENISYQINSIPALVIRLQCYGQLAAKAFTLGLANEAAEIVENRILTNIEKIENSDRKSQAIEFLLPVIFRYDKERAIELAKEIPENMKDYAFLMTVIWVLSNGNLNEDFDSEKLKISSYDPSLRDFALVALSHINTDNLLFCGINAICEVISNSVQHQSINPLQADSLLVAIEELILTKLPDQQNIKHEGYKIACNALVEGARSIVYKSTQKKGQLSSVEIRRRWGTLVSEADNISNLADKVFVKTIIAQEFYKHDEEKAKNLLKNTEDLVDKIPAIIDRFDRLELIGKTWGYLGEKDLSKFVMEKASELIAQMSDLAQNKKLETLVQAAYEFDRDFAEQIVERFDSRFPEKIFNPVAITHEAIKLISNPGLIVSGEDATPYHKMVMAGCAEKLYSDLIKGNAKLPAENILREWVYRASDCDQTTFFSTLRWVQECVIRLSLDRENEFGKSLVELTTLLGEYAKLGFSQSQTGIPEEIIGILPGLSAKITVFGSGETQKATEWMKKWLSKNTDEYLKIVDPYFSPNDIHFFTNLPCKIKLIIVTTDSMFTKPVSSIDISEQIKSVWFQNSRDPIPQICMWIVPKSQEELFHDRVIVSKNRGLDIGQSLNGLGKKIGKITDLPYEEAKEVESKYIDLLLNQTSWFLKHSISPLVVTLGD